jgi:Protein of unknown function (DUF1493)
VSEIIHYTDFKTLRQAYLEVKKFLESESGDDVISIDTKIADDLGCAGDDNWDLLTRFVTKYKLDVTGFDYSKHFLSEGELFDSGTALLQLLVLPIRIVFLLIALFTFGKHDFTSKRLMPDWNRETTDMTFGDMLSWYLTGKYNLRKDVRIEFKAAA